MGKHAAYVLEQCQEQESGGVQCDLVSGHKDGHWINMGDHDSRYPKEYHPEQWKGYN